MATLRCGDREIDIYDIVSSDSARWWWDARWQSAKDEMPPDADTLEAIDAALARRCTAIPKTVIVVVYRVGRGYLAVYADYLRYGGLWTTDYDPCRAVARLLAGDYGRGKPADWPPAEYR